MQRTALLAYVSLALLTLSSLAHAGIPRGAPATPQFRHIGINQGLPTDNVYTVVEGPRGLIWMGTRDGLVRYDGTTFKVFRNIPGNPNSLAGNDISSVLVDGKGRVWASGEAGLNLYNPSTNTFRRFRHDPTDAASLGNNSVMALARGADGSLWVGTFGGGLDHMATPGRFTHQLHQQGDPTSLASDIVLSIHAGTHGQLWVGTAAGLDLRTADGTFHPIVFEGVTKPPRVWHVSPDHGSLRIDTSVGVFMLRHRRMTATRLDANALPAMTAMDSVRDAAGDLWIASHNGLYLLRANGQVTHFPTNRYEPGGQPGRMVWHLMLDHEGGLWVATQNAGVAYLGPDWRDFSHFAHQPGNAHTLSGSRILALAAAPNGRLWVGGEDGQLDLLDPRSGKVVHASATLGVAPRSVIALASAGRYGVWVGFHGGMGLFDGHHLRRVSAADQGTGVRWIAAAGDGTAYFSPPGYGMWRVDPVHLQAQPLKLGTATEAAKETHALAFHAGYLWRASGAGLSRLTPDHAGFKLVPGIAPGPVLAFAFSGSDLWLARPHMLEHDRVEGTHVVRIARIDANAGWSGVDVNAMTIDSRGRVWLFTSAGLWCYDPVHRRFLRFGREDGLPSQAFTSFSLVHAPGGRVFAGTLRGVIGFQPAQEHAHPRSPRLILAAASVRRAGRRITLPVTGHDLHVGWRERDLTVTARALSYIDPRRNHYRFRLLGFDPGWVDTGTRGTRELAGLSPGQYQLAIEAAGPSGAWGALAPPLSITVAAPPWARPWAWGIYTLIAALAVWLVLLTWRRRLVTRHRVQLIEHERALAERANAAKTRFLATLSHEIRTPMTGVLGMAELLQGSTLGRRERGYAQAIHRSGKLLLKLVNDALDVARIEAGRLELEPAPMRIRAVLAEAHELLAGQVGDRPVQLVVDTAPDVPEWLQADALRLQQIVLNLATNAIKFTREGEVRIAARYRDGRLRLAVSDTGPGIRAQDQERLFRRFEQADSPQRRSGSGLGLAICRELATLMGGQMDVTSTFGAGSCFTVTLPLPAIEPAGLPTQPAPTATVRWRLLLVEDDATVAQVITGLLAVRGHQVAHAAHGLAALAYLETDRFDAVLLDLDLPGMDGFALASLLRQRPGGEHRVLIAITARSGGNEEQRAYAAGMNAFMRKPLTGDELETVLADHLRDSGHHGPKTV